jgi:hypothetical protein
MRPSILVLVTAILVPAAGAAETRWVDAAGNTPYFDVQAAIDDSQDGDVVLVFPGTYAPIDFGSKQLIVRSIGGPDLTTIDASSVGGSAVVMDETGPGLLLHGFTITGGDGIYEGSVLATVGGGLLIRRQAQGRVSGNVIVGNTAELGGGVAILESTPILDGNSIALNTATGVGGGVWIHAPEATEPVVLVCTDILENTGAGVGGLYVGDSLLEATNLVFNANVGERGGLWVTLQADGFLQNATYVSNESTGASAAGLETESETFAFSGNLVVGNEDGWGVIRGSAAAPWTYNDVFDNDLGAYSGAALVPTGTDGNLAVSPSFLQWTSDDGLDDDLHLVPGDVLLDLGDPDAGLVDPDGSRNAIGFEGGPRLQCDLDGDGVGPAEGDCRPAEAAFFPHAYELEGGLDTDCDGFGTSALVNLVTDDGGLSPGVEAVWTFDEPTAVPGLGHQGIAAWCTGCDGPTAPGVAAVLDLSVDLTALAVDTEVRLLLVHAYDTGADVTALSVQYEGVGGGFVTLVEFGGQELAWAPMDVPLPGELSGTVFEVRFELAALSVAAPGWSIGRIAVQVVDADGDGRSVDLADCDDTDPTIYDGAQEVPYDSIDQDCDGADLLDVDGDGFNGVGGGGDDCDDEDPLTFPGGIEIPYDSIDQDCSGSDLTDVDGDGFAAEEVGGSDCDDNDAAIFPDAAEVPYDGVDDDCDGEDLTDVDGDGFEGNVEPPFGDCDDEDPDVHPDAEEVCDDGVDNDCDGAVDLLPDLDGDGVDLCAGDCDDTDPDVSPELPEACDGVDTDCDGEVPDDEVDADGDGSLLCDGDCDESNPDVGAGFPEVCDGIDNNCDGVVDEGHDLDGDGFSGCNADCDDQRSTVFPGAEIDCEDNVDHDCDGVRDFEQDECTGAACSCDGAEASFGGRGGAGAGLALLAVLGWRRRRSR